MVSIHVLKPQENLNQSEEKAENTIFFFLEVCLMELDQGKIINCVPDKIFPSYLKPFWKR